MMSISETDKAWAAGFLEGEGSFVIRSTGSGLTVEVSAAQVVDNSQSLRKLHYLFGGNLAASRVANSRHRPKIRFGLSGSPVLVLLKAILPYMQSKREEAEILVEALTAREEFLAGRKTKPGTSELLKPFRDQLHAMRPGSVNRSDG